MRSSRRSPPRSPSSGLEACHSFALPRLLPTSLSPAPLRCNFRALEYEAASSSPPSKTLRRGDVAGVLRELRRDYARQYFVTALVTDAIYDPGCYFADPTVSFRGAQRFVRPPG